MNMKRAIRKFWFGWSWLRQEGAVLWRSLLDKDTPMSARLVALGLIVYVISPIDLIPDFIPVLGWIDDLIILPIGLALVRGMVPEEVWMRAGGVVMGADGKPLRDVTPRRRRPVKKHA